MASLPRLNGRKIRWLLRHRRHEVRKWQQGASTRGTALLTAKARFVAHGYSDRWPQSVSQKDLTKLQKGPAVMKETSRSRAQKNQLRTPAAGELDHTGDKQESVVADQLPNSGDEFWTPKTRLQLIFLGIAGLAFLIGSVAILSTNLAN
jgi:hypothetical protein